MINTQPFSVDAPSILVTATETATVAVTIPGSGNTVRIVNTGTKTAYIACDAAPTAVVPSSSSSRSATAILAGGDITLGRSPGATKISAIVATGDTSTTLVVSSGEGF